MVGIAVYSRHSVTTHGNAVEGNNYDGYVDDEKLEQL
jgi:hypothetical protein